MKAATQNKTYRQASDAGLSEYFNSLGNAERITPEEETRIANLYRENGQQRYADKLVTANLRFVVKIALEYRNYGFPLLDLIQEGNLGLVRAVKTFDPARGYRLISYGVWWIRAFIQEHILHNWSLVKIGTTQTQRKLFNHMQSAQKRLQNLTGEDDLQRQREKLAEKVGGTVKDVIEMETRIRIRARSLDVEVSRSGEDMGSPYDRLAVDETTTEERVADQEQGQLRTKHLTQALATLGEREREIIKARHLSGKKVTLRELGGQLSISKERVRQIEERGLRALREVIKRSCNVEELLAA